MAVDAGTIYSEIRIQLDKLTGDIAQVNRKFNQLGKDTDKESKDVGDSWDKTFAGIALAATAAFAIIAGAIKTAVDQFAKAEQSLANVRSVSNATEKDFIKLKEAALDAGASTRFTASQAADALYYLASAGLNAKQATEALTGVLALAGATGSDLAFTAETMTAALAQFNIDAGDSERVANVFAAAIGNSQATMEKLSSALRQVGPIAGSLDISLEETTASLEALFNAGFRGEQAGTALRSILLDLADSTSPVIQKLEAAGVTFDQVNPRIVGLTGAIDLLSKSGVDLGAVFGKVAAAEIITLGKVGGKALQDLEADITNTKAAAFQYAIQNDTLAGSIDETASAAESLGIAVGEGLSPILRGIIDNVGGFLAGLAKMPSGLLAVGIAIAAIATGIPALIAGFQALAVVVPALAGVAAALGAAAAPITIVAAAVVALGISIAGINQVIQDNKKLDFEKQFGRLTQDLMLAGEAADNFRRIAIEITKRLKDIKPEDMAEQAMFLSRAFGVSLETIIQIAEYSGQISQSQQQQLRELKQINDESRKRQQEQLILYIQEKINKNFGWLIEKYKENQAQQEARRQQLLQEQMIAEELARIAQEKAALETQINAIEMLGNKGLLDRQDVLTKITESRGKLINKIIEESITSGTLTDAQKKFAEELIALQKKQQAELDALTSKEKENTNAKSDNTDQSKRRAEIEAEYHNQYLELTGQRLQLLEIEKTNAIKNAKEVGADTTEIIKVYDLKKKEILDEADAETKRKAEILTGLLSDEYELRTSKFEIELGKQVEEFREAGATEEEIAKYTSEQRQKYEAETTAALVKEYTGYVDQIADAAFELLNALNDINDDRLEKEIDIEEKILESKLESIDEELAARKKAIESYYGERIAQLEAEGKSETELREFLEAKNEESFQKNLENKRRELAGLANLDENYAAQNEEQFLNRIKNNQAYYEARLDDSEKLKFQELLSEIENIKEEKRLREAAERERAQREDVINRLKDKENAENITAEKKAEDDALAAKTKAAHDIAQLEYEQAVNSYNLRMAEAIVNSALSIVSSLTLPPPAGPIAAVAAGIAGAAAIATIAANPPPPPSFQTGGIVLPSSSGRLVRVAENGASEMLLNGGSDGKQFLNQFADSVADRIGSGQPGIIQLYIDGRKVAESTAKYISDGIVRVTL